MRRLIAVLTLGSTVLLGATACDSADADHPSDSFTTPADGSVRVSQGTVTSGPAGVEVGVGGVLKDPDRAMLSVLKSGAESVQLTLAVGDHGTAFGHTVAVSAIEFGDHDYVWLKISPS
ncbi:hypothetical protein [Kribbella sp. C-35]|uniref:hypothetical protein n=1 Tax=Kribbella sp. C-35 TaxID=2789276 RepID=UPI003979A7FF